MIIGLQEATLFGSPWSFWLHQQHVNKQQFGLYLHHFWTGPIIYLNWPKDSFLFFGLAKNISGLTSEAAIM